MGAGEDFGHVNCFPVDMQPKGYSNSLLMSSRRWENSIMSSSLCSSNTFSWMSRASFLIAHRVYKHTGGEKREREREEMATEENENKLKTVINSGRKSTRSGERHWMRSSIYFLYRFLRYSILLSCSGSPF